jgi:hypothetical protein
MDIRNAYKTFVEKAHGKKTFGRFRCRWKDNIKMAVRETGGEGAYWTEPA